MPAPTSSWAFARLLLAVVGVLALLSFGGQIYYGFAILVLEWWAAARSETGWRALFVVLAGLLAAEMGWILGHMITEADTPGAFIGGAVGIAVTAVFWRTTNPTPSS
jgi:hypothetical protein